MKRLKHFTCNEPIRHDFHAASQSSAALLHIFWVLYLLGQYIFIKGSLEMTQSNISWVLYWSGIEFNTKKYILTTLSHIS